MKIGTIKLSHFSVKEYLLSERIDKNFSISERVSHSKISEISVAYLLQFHSFEPLTDAMLDSSQLALYAAEHWIDHAKSGGMGSVVLKLILQLFTSEAAPLTNWIRMWNIDDYWYRKDLGMNKAEVLSPLYYASLAGMEDVSYELLERGGNANVKGGEYGNALQAASYGGNEPIVKLLLENGADVNAEGGKYRNALQAALSRGNTEVVKLLLDKGGEAKNALQAA